MSLVTQKLCLIDPLTLLGRELLRLLEAHPGLANELQYAHTQSDEEHQITELDGHPALVAPLDSLDELAGAGIIIVCSDQDSPRLEHLEQHLDIYPETVLIDCSRLERLWDLTQPTVGALAVRPSPPRLRVAHPTLVASHCLLDGLRPFDPRGVTVAALEPVSGLGREAIASLARQASQRLQGKEVSERIDERVLAFNMSAEHGDQLTEEAAQVLATPAVTCSLIRTGCFHGHLAHIGVFCSDEISEHELLETWASDQRIVIQETPLALDTVVDCNQVVIAEPIVSPDRHSLSVTAMVDGLLIGGALTALEIAQGTM